MSVLIKGMEMPKSCYDCDFAYQDQDSEHNVYWTCAAVHKSDCMHECRDDCPLIPVPPHGDLIGKEELINFFANNGVSVILGLSASRAVDEIIKFIKKAPTVIPAEPGEEETCTKM